MLFELHILKPLAMRTKIHKRWENPLYVGLHSHEKCHNNSHENLPMFRIAGHVQKYLTMRNDCDSDSCCGLTCDASTGDANRKLCGSNDANHYAQYKKP